MDLDFQSLPKTLSELSLHLYHSSGLLLCPPIFVSSPNNRPAKALPLDRSPTDPNQCPSSEFHKFCSSISISKESLVVPLKPLSRISRLEDIPVNFPFASSTQDSNYSNVRIRISQPDSEVQFCNHRPLCRSEMN